MKEDYVSFEIAKLLKEKGFDEDCLLGCSETNHQPVSFHPYCKNSGVGEFIYAVPTIQMALKWLREEKNLFIGIDPRLSHSDYSYITAYIYRTKKRHSYYYDDDIIEYDSCAQCDGHSFENACENAIKFCLDYLIK